MNSYTLSVQTDNLSDNLTFMFRDPSWKMKVLLGGVLSVIPILGFATAGYMLAVIRNIRDSRLPVMPDWGPEFGEFFTRGFVLAIITFIYTIPSLIISSIGSVMAQSSEGFVAFLGWLFMLGMLAYSVAVFFIVQAAVVQYAITSQFSSAFNFPVLFVTVKNNVGRMLKTLAIYLIGGMVAGILVAVLVLIPCIGWLATILISVGIIFYLEMVMAYNAGFIARNATPGFVMPAQVTNSASNPNRPTPPQNLGGWE